MQRLAAVAVSVRVRTQKHVECDWNSQWLTRERVQVQSERESDRSLTLPLSARNKHWRHSRSQRLHRADANKKPSERADGFTDGSTRTQSAKVRVQAGRQQVKSLEVATNDRVDGEGSGTIVLSAPVSSSKDEMTIGGLYVVDGIDVLATLVPEEDVWQSEATEACTTETQMQDREQESIVTGEWLDSEEVRKGRAKEVRELDEVEVKMEVDESEMRVALGKKIWSKWVETQKDPNGPAIRCPLCAPDVNTGESRSDTFAATPPLKFVRLILSWAAIYKPKRANASMIIAVFDISLAFFHVKVRMVI